MVFPGGRFLSPTDYTGTSLAPSGAEMLSGRGEATGGSEGKVNGGQVEAVVAPGKEKRRRDSPAAKEPRGGPRDPKDEPRLALTSAERIGGGLRRGGACRPGTDVGDESPTGPECCVHQVASPQSQSVACNEFWGEEASGSGMLESAVVLGS